MAKVHVLLYIGPEWSEIAGVFDDLEYAKEVRETKEKERKRKVSSWNPAVDTKAPPKNWTYDSLSTYALFTYDVKSRPAPKVEKELKPVAPVKTAPEPDKPTPLQLCLSDLRKLYGISPYNTPANIQYGDGYFASEIQGKYTQETLEMAHTKLGKVCSMTSTHKPEEKA